jgi:glycosyltransferase involved in cell wall biosynthesis
LEAAQRLGPEHYRFRAVGAFVRDAGRLPDVGHVEYVPWQDRPGLAEIYRSATVLVMPSRWESFGLVAVEAMSYGLPVIASDCCSLPEIVRPGVNGWLFRTGDADDLVRTLQGLSWTDYAHASAACLNTYLSMYTSNSMTDNCAGLYRSIAMPLSKTSPVEVERIDLSV